MYILWRWFCVWELQIDKEINRISHKGDEGEWNLIEGNEDIKTWDVTAKQLCFVTYLQTEDQVLEKKWSLKEYQFHFWVATWKKRNRISLAFLFSDLFIKENIGNQISWPHFISATYNLFFFFFIYFVPLPIFSNIIVPRCLLYDKCIFLSHNFFLSLVFICFTCY